MKFDLRCSLHKTYKAKRYPKSECKACVALWFLNVQKSYVVDFKDGKGFISLEAK